MDKISTAAQIIYPSLWLVALFCRTQNVDFALIYFETEVNLES